MTKQSNSTFQRIAACFTAGLMAFSTDSGSTWTALTADNMASLGYTALPSIQDITDTDTSSWVCSLNEGLFLMDEKGNAAAYKLVQSSAPDGYTASYDADNALTDTLNEQPAVYSLAKSGSEDVTDNLDQLSLSISKLTIVDKSGKTQDVAVTDGSCDISSFPLASIDHYIAELSFTINHDGDARTIKEGDTFTCTAPEIFAMQNISEPQSITSSDGTEIATYTIADNKATVTFSQSVNLDEGYNKIGGELVCSFSLDMTKYSAESNPNVQWTLQNGGTPFTITLPPSSSTLSGIDKTGAYNKDDSSVTWKITVGTDAASKGISLAGITVNDSYSKQQMNTPTVTDENGSKLDVTSTDAGFSYTFPSDSKAVAPYTLTVKGDVSDDVLKASVDSSQSISNTASLPVQTAGNVTVPAEQTKDASVTVPSFSISKSGVQLSSSAMEWSLIVNEDESGSAEDVIVYDKLDSRATYTADSLQINNKKIDVLDSAPADTSKTYGLLVSNDDGTHTLEIHFAGTISTKQTIVFDTDIKMEEAEKNKDTVFANSAWIEYKWPGGHGPDPVTRKPLSITPEFNVASIEKSCEGHDNATGEISWKIEPSVRTDQYSDWNITDTINPDQSLIEDSVIVKDGDKTLTAGTDYTYTNSDSNLTFAFDGSIHKVNDIAITYKTSALNYKAENYIKHTYSDTADISVHSTLNTDTYFKDSDEDSTVFENKFLKKTGNYEVVDSNKTSTGYLHYQITVNASHMSAANLTVKDDLTAMTATAYSASSANTNTGSTNFDASKWTVADNKTKVTEVKKNNDKNDVTANYTDAVNALTNSKILDISFSDSTATDSSYIVDFYLTLSQDELKALQETYPNGYSIATSNTSNASAAEYNSGNAATVTANTSNESPTITNKLVSKSGDTSTLTGDSPYIGYTINVNPNGLDMKDTVITDTPDSCLNIDINSVKLYYAKHDGNGNISSDVGDEVDSSDWSKNLTAADNKTSLQVKIPNGTASYVIKYDAKVISAPANGTSVSNSISAAGTNYAAAGDTCAVEVDSAAWGWMSKAATVKLVKYDAESGTTAALSGASYSLYSDEACTSLVASAVTNANGVASFYGLPYSDEGISYYYKETSAPAGYQLDTKAYLLSETKAGVQKITVSDERSVTDSTVEIKKSYSPLNGNTISDSKSSFEISLCPNGTESSDRKSVTFTGDNGVYAYSAFASNSSKAAAVVNSTDASSIKLSGLPWGTYAIKETDPQKGYAAYSGEKYFSIAQDGTISYVPTSTEKDIGTEETITNNPTSITLTKTCDNGHDLTGAVLTVYTADKDGKKTDTAAVSPFDSSTYTFTVAAKSAAITSQGFSLAGLPAGTYYLSEDTAPANDMDLGKISDVKFTVNKDGTVTINSGSAALDTAKTAITVHDNTASVSLKKLDQFGNGVIGAAIKLQVKNGNDWTDVTGQSWESTKDDAKTGHTFSSLERGKTYQLIETAIPAGYRTSNHTKTEAITFTINEYGNVEKGYDLGNGQASNEKSGNNYLNSYDKSNAFTMRNERILSEVQFTKYDSTKENKALSGVTFNLLKENEQGTYDIISSGLTSDDSGLVSTLAASADNSDTGLSLSKGLTAGNYEFIETSTHSDFVLDATPHKFTVTDNDAYTWSAFTVKTLFEKPKITNAPLNASITLSKTDSSSNQAVIGATYELRQYTSETDDTKYTVIDTQTTSKMGSTVTKTDSNGNTHTYTASADGQLIFGNVLPGTYRIYETKTAKGYQLDASSYIKATVSQTKKDVNQSFDCTDTQNSVTIAKTDETGSSVAGASFKLSGEFADGSKEISWESGTDAKTIAGQMISGNIYKLSETKAPQGYIKTDDVYLKMNDSGVLSSSASKDGEYIAVTDNALNVVNRKNTIILGKFSDDSPAVALDNSVFTITGIFAGKETEETRNLLTKENYGELTGQLVGGNTYTITETAAPVGFEMVPSFQVKMNEDGTVTLLDGNPDNVTVSGSELTVVDTSTSITVNKTDEKGNKLTGSYINLYGVFSDDNEQHNITIVNGESSGTLKRELIIGNSYTVTEFKSPDGYSAVPAFTITVNADGSLSAGKDKPKNVTVDKQTVTIMDSPITVSASKTDEDDNALKNAKYTVYGIFADGSIEKEFTSDKNAVSLSKQFIAGNTYVLAETEAPAGYTRMTEPVSFTVNNDGTLSLSEGTPSNVTLSKDKNGFIITDTKIDISVAKTDRDTGKTLKGSSFKVSGKFIDGTAEIAGSAESLEAQLKGNLYASDLSADKSTWHVYTLEETEAPKGYIKETKNVQFIVNDTSKVIVISDEDQCTSVDDSGKVIAFKNAPVSVSFQKTDAAGNALSNAKFTVNGTFADGSSSKNFTSYELFNAQFIAGNTYTLKETEAPAGYTRMTETVSFTVNNDGTLKLADSTPANVTLDNSGKELLISDRQIQAVLQKTSRNTGEVLHGVTFRVSGAFTDGTSEVSGDPETISAALTGKLYASDTSKASSTWHIYTMAEVKAPDGYAIESKPVTFIVDDTAALHIIGDEDSCASIKDGVLQFSDPFVSVAIHKLDEEGNSLTGAKMAVSGTFADGSTEKEFTSDTEAEKIDKLLIIGNSYTLAETEAPAGYTRMTDTVSFTVNGDGTLALAENTPSNVTLSKDKTGIEVADTMLDVSVKKTAKDTGESLEGSSFKVSGTFISGTEDIEGSAESLEAQLKGNLYTSDPSADKNTWHVYTLQETEAPKGYLLEKKSISFIIDETSRVTVIDDEDKAASISEKNTLTVTDIPTEVSILKTDKDGNALSNAKFTVNGAFADGSSSISFTSSSKAKKYSALFIAGNTYTLTETEAPEGYEKLSAGIVFTLDEDGNVILKDSNTAEVKDDNTIQVADVKKEVIADTGDSSNIAAQIAILISSLVLAAGMIMYRRKKLS